MLRRPPTAISLLKQDIIEHFRCIEQRRSETCGTIRNGTLSSVPSKIAIYATSTDCIGSGEEWQDRRITPTSSARVLCIEGDVQSENSELSQCHSDISDLADDDFYRGLSENADRFSTRATSDSPQNGRQRHHDTCSKPEDNFGPIVLDDTVGLVAHHQTGPKRTLSPSRYSYNSGDFVEARIEDPSFASEDPSTPRTESLPGMRRTRKRRDTYYRLPLCRTYGVDSIHARSACSITAHVPSRGWRGLLLSNPARRPRSFRSRTISHSYEKSEVTNASYENFQASDNDSISSFSHPLDTRNLHEELRGSSLQSVSTVGNTTSTPLKPLSGQHARSEISQAELVSDDRRVLMLSSLRLSLPRPFSAAPRSSSLNAAALFVADVDQRPFQPRSVSTPRSHELAELPDIMGATLSKSYGEEGLRALFVGSPFEWKTQTFQHVARHRSQSPTHPWSEGSNLRTLSLLRGCQEYGEPVSSSNTTPVREWNIYNDGLPASLQPQTPAHLPETRNQSRYHPLYTAPARSAQGTPPHVRRHTTRHRGTRSNSPPGMDTPGFRGLYGGRENAEDDILFHQANRRIWTRAQARINNRLDE